MASAYVAIATVGILVHRRLLDVLAGAAEPVSFFGYPGVPSRLTPEGCHLATLAELAAAGAPTGGGDDGARV